MESVRTTSPYFGQLVTAIKCGNCATLRGLVEAGADINELDEYGNDSVLFAAVDELSGNAPQLNHPVTVLDAVRLALALGADPYPTHFSLQQFNDEGQLGILSGPILENDLELAAVLLQSGVDPNWVTLRQRELHAGQIYNLFSEAEQRYTDFHYGYNGPLPDPCVEADVASSAAWLDYLDRMAIRHGVQRPDVLCLLHDFGARSREEIERIAPCPDHYRQQPVEFGLPLAIANCLSRKDFAALEILTRVNEFTQKKSRHQNVNP